MKRFLLNDPIEATGTMVEKKIIKNSRYHHNLSAAQFDKGDLDTALLNSFQAIELEFAAGTNNPWFVRHLLRLLVESKKPYLTEVIYKHTVKSNVNLYLLALQYARALHLMKRDQEAIQVLAAAIDNAPADASQNELKKLKSYLKFLSS